jgi:hypothetical protein
VTVLTLRVSETVDAVCDHCGSRDLARLMSRFAMGRSDESRLDALVDDSGGVDEGDPKSMSRWMRRMGDALGEDAGEDFDGMVDELAQDAPGDDDGGESPE